VKGQALLVFYSANACATSSRGGNVAVRVIRADKEWTIAKTVCRVFGLPFEIMNHYENKSD